MALDTLKCRLSATQETHRIITFKSLKLTPDKSDKLNKLLNIILKSPLYVQ